MEKKKRNILLVTCASILLLIGVVSGGMYYYFFAKPFSNTETIHIYIDKDDTIDSVYTKINKEIPSVSLKGFKWLSKYSEYEKKIRTGRYSIFANDNTIKLFKRISRGQQTPVKITFNNIRTKEQLAKSLGSQLMIDSCEIATKLNSPEFQHQMGYTNETIISMFIPNTYEVYWNTSTTRFLERMQQEHTKFWNQERLNKAYAIGLTPEEVATLASIVEEETNDNAEKPTVAGLYLNRLKKGMPLQADPTVKFATGDFGLKRIYNEHLKIDSPYNTYKYTGLPPGPIRIPSIKGIDSVLNYEKHNYLYMCAKEDFSGRHNFASTFAQHQQNARKYQNALNKRNIF